MRHSDEKWMAEAIKVGRQARVWSAPNPPVGCVIVRDDELLATGFTHPTGQQHAEVHALSQTNDAAGATAYVTLEPCAMCFGAMIHARIERIVFGAYDPKTGVCGSCMNLNDKNFFNHKISITGGILEKESSELIRLFFKSRRVNKE